jgi:hypothetical protein
MEQVPLGRARGLEALGKTREIRLGQQRRADDLGLRVGLQDAANGCADVEIGELRFLDQVREFARAKAPPPIERRRCGLPPPRAIFGRDVGREIRPCGGESAPGQHLHES